LKQRLHLIAGLAGTRARAATPLHPVARALSGLALACTLAGCRHKTKPLVLPQAAHAPIELEDIPPPASLPDIAALPPPQLKTLPTPPPPPPPRRRRAAPPKEAPVQVASAPETAAVAIGALSAGADVTQQSQQQARDLIASILKRIAALPAKTADDQKTNLRQVKQFLDQAQKALDSGDAEGAKNLATKAKVLMDDIEKK
jgi:hypothetical protein